MNARLASRAGRLRRRSSLRRLDQEVGQSAAGPEVKDLVNDVAEDVADDPRDPETFSNVVSHAAPARFPVNPQPIPLGTLLEIGRAHV